MSWSRLPPEISDYVVDLLQDEAEALHECCLVSKSWTPRARKPLFGEVAFNSLVDLKVWKETFPDPLNSPAHYTRCLFINTEKVIPAAVVEESGLVQAFSNVVRLELWGMRYFRLRFLPLLLTRSRIRWVVSISEQFSAPRLFNLVCSLPLLEDLQMIGCGIGNYDDNSTILQPPTSPPLTGSLGLYFSLGMEPAVRRLLELPNGAHFRKLECAWHLAEDIRWTKAMVERYSDTLERVEIMCMDLRGELNSFRFPYRPHTFTSALVELRAGSVDFSKAINLKEGVFRLEYTNDVWTAMALKTLTSEHKDFQKVSIHISIHPSPEDEPDNIRETIGEKIYKQWMDLDRVLVQL